MTVTPTDSISATTLRTALRQACEALLGERERSGHWQGELSSSALSTATAVTALELLRRCGEAPDDGPVAGLIEGGLAWLARHVNRDGGWGDTVCSHSNIATTALAAGAFRAADRCGRYAAVAQRGLDWVERAGGIEGIRRRYGKDRTFSVPILTQLALAGVVDWDDVSPLPFELACLPPQLYRWARLPVVSYALPALIAIGQARYHALPPKSASWRFLRRWCCGPSLRLLERIQPSSGGFLEATPLTAFVTMSLISTGRYAHPVVQRGVEFLRRSVRRDGSWPIDTNLATWVSTLSVNALGDRLPAEARLPLRDWLLQQQYKQVHPYTHAAPGGWAWTDLPGGVPDVDDTSGAILALLELSGGETPRQAIPGDVADACAGGVRWLLDLQNRDGGWPTFCRGWGKLPFDRSAPDLTAHSLRALLAWQRLVGDGVVASPWTKRLRTAVRRGFAYLARSQRPDGSWVPLWFGNQDAADEENPVYGTSRVLLAYQAAGLLDSAPARRGASWLAKAQHRDGGWGGSAGVTPSVEETALAVQALACMPSYHDRCRRAVQYLIERQIQTNGSKPSPIGLYFAKLWYSERLYPWIFTVSALRQAEKAFADESPESGVPPRAVPAEPIPHGISAEDVP